MRSERASNQFRPGKQIAPTLREQNLDVVPIHECQNSTTTPWLGARIRDPIVPPVEIDDVVHETLHMSAIPLVVCPS